MPNTNLGIYYPDDTTNVTPLHTVLGAISTSVDSYLAANATIHTIANTAGRAAVIAKYPPTVSNPVFTWRQDATSGKNLEYTLDGTTWKAIGDTSTYPVIPGAWTPYTPTWTNLTVGNGSVNGGYVQIGKTVHFQTGILWGTTTSASGIWHPSIPVPVSVSGAWFPCSAWMFDSSTSTFNVGAFVPNTYILSSTGQVHTTAPWTWGANDRVYINGSYEAN
jgi:hypothetical protein